MQFSEAFIKGSSATPSNQVYNGDLVYHNSDCYLDLA